MGTQTLHAELPRHGNTRTTVRTRADCVALDVADPLAAMRERFALPDDVIYLDGNSLGALPKATASQVADVIERQWGNELIASWNSAGWIAAPRRIGDALAPLIGAREGEVVVADSTSINLFKVLTVAMRLATENQSAGNAVRNVVLSEADNFPTDLYIAEGVLRQLSDARGNGATLDLVPATASAARSEAIVSRLDASTAVLMLTHVNYRTGRLHDMAQVTRDAQNAGALVLWDLAHSAGAVPVDLKAADADFAVGCGYKYLNGGPGAPAFVWAHPRHTARMDRDQLRQPLSGWFGHAAPFEFTPDYQPALGVQRFACGTPPVLSMSALECGVDVFLKTEAQGGMAALRHKSIALTTLFTELVEARCADHGLTLVTPREPAQRGSQVSFAHEQGYAIMQALIARGVIGDFRAGEMGAAPESSHLLRFGFTPLYTRFAEVWDAVDHLRQVLTTREWRETRFNQRAAVT